MRWCSDRTGRECARAAVVLVLGTIVLLATAWITPRASDALGTWAKSPPGVTTRTVTVAPRLQVGRAGHDCASPAERLRSGREAGVTTLDVGQPFTMLGLMCDVPAGDAEVEVRLRTSLDGRDWSVWYAAPLEVAGEEGVMSRAYTDALWSDEGRFVQVCAAAVGDDAPLALTAVELMALDTEGGSGVVASAAAALRQVVATVSGVGLAAQAQAAVETPAWVTRAGWGADESLRTGDPVYAPVKMAFVHHTAGGNAYTREQAASVVRGIHVYHTTGLGWSDIGYNFLIDRFGTVYVGRAGGPRQGVVGAHVYGFNTGSTGVSVMGTYASGTPPAAAMDALGHLLAWKLEVHGLDPLASVKMTCGATEKYAEGRTVTLPVVSGHRDANYTACPGDALYAKLGAVRSAAAAQIKLAAVTPEPYTLSLALSATEVPVDTAVTYSGTVKTAAGAPAAGTVAVQKRRADGGDWIAWRTAKLDASGRYSVAVTMTSAPRDWQFRARMPGDGAANLTGVSVLRDLRVTLPAAPYTLSLALSATEVPVDTAVTYSGTVTTAAGAPAAGTVAVQKRRADGGDWIAWRTAKLDASGRYSVAVTMTSAPRDWQFRARMPGDGGLNQTGYSALAVLTVGGASGAYRPGEYAFTITGRGWGHGIGMSQWGAYGLAAHGKGYEAILRHYYAGIQFGEVKNRTLRVLLRKGPSSVKLTCADAYTVQGEVGPFTIAGGTTATVTRAGDGYRVIAGSFDRVFDAAVTFTPTQRRLEVVTATDLGQTGMHRGRIRVAASGSSLLMINLVALESYLRAVVPHEVSPSWPSAALRAQVCAARSYAESARRSATGQWDLYCDVRSQAYGGVEWEDRRTDAAVWATKGVVPVYDGSPIQAFYFSCSGGRTESIENAWRTSAVPYLKSVDDPYDSAAPLHTWGPLRRTPAEMADALGGAARGTVRAIYRVRAGASPRIVKAAIVGSEGTTYLHGNTLRTRLGLNSAWATFRSMSIRPSAAEAVVASPGESTLLSGSVYPAVASGARVTLHYRSDGAWNSRSVSTVRHALKLGDAYAARYSTYKVTVSPAQTSEYYFQRGVASSPRTTITVK